ncbi:putative clathrin assembly protein AP19 [Toxoplasma gondii TgCatPRC2]|uniref:AP complex subunit sigma n=14 Tax=Toxoplasma gondii TaxID=5811 RepID=B9PHV7_TOXGV|nr:clathrin assembly protein AP19, putative [Toxoplasma gondii ME49]EPR64755.1 putative clathrin assembly protein AP19 [Toxoplasma gondii GT1]ESS36229.1 putative clathrin assembly protein AP19 [Toxoplasma gondii VEG]KAF4642285.1 putative clathrin assembly protein AP19 [Toxoplasma gondii]KFG43707.1 putative clathrin assembly protein AP19 [Toxoplasma gondii GAB2-2007-GAL-DOM2]KFG61603.1 putative clathrin assembly protein AP19 [Toxoplasma gondii RUB]KFH05952.1 putative clathrin assembly protein |eukprot:XP_002365713.1 clathrin assembly protein AP19, putative [Toxoplasma gondii ME49]
MIHFLLLVSRQGKVRLSRWYLPPSCSSQGPSSGSEGAFAAGLPMKERSELLREAASRVLQRSAKQCNVVEWRDDTKLVFKRYASLFFIACVDSNENALLTLEVIHHFVEILDRYFGNVCELDLIFNFHKAYYLLDEIICGGELQETSKKAVLRVMNAQDALMEESNTKGGVKLT